MRTARSAKAPSRMEEAVLRSTSSSCITGRIRSSSDMPWAMEWAWAESTKMAELVSTRSHRSTQNEARALNSAGYPSPPMIDSCTLRFSGIATSPASMSTASTSKSQRNPHVPTSRVMALSGGFVVTSAAVQPTTGFRRMGLISTRSTGTQPSSWGTPPNRTARWKRLLAWRSPITVRKDWRDSKIRSKHTRYCNEAEITTLVPTDSGRCFGRRGHRCFHGGWTSSSANQAGEESCWRPSLHANQRSKERNNPLPLVCERCACRGGACRDRRRRFWGTEPHLPHQTAERLRGCRQRYPHAGPAVSVYYQ